MKVCIGWKSRGKGSAYMRDVSPLVDALATHTSRLPGKNIEVLVIGREARVPEQFVKQNLTNHVEVHNNILGFYEYQKILSSCHTLIPLVHPKNKGYFLGKEADEQGRLSGMIAQVIGSQIPSLIHDQVAEIYKDEFTAPYFVYNDSETTNFQVAFDQLVEYYLELATVKS